jgi:TonB family protein
LDIDLTSDTLPDWLRKPTFDQLMATYPQEAGKKGKSGMAKIRCWVQLSGLLRSCTVINESPPGLGFGSAALVLAPTMLMKPATRQGQPVESEVTIPIVFKLDYPLNIASSKSIMVMSQVVWAKAPTMTEILSALDKKVGDKFAQGRVAYQCAVDRGTGRLHDCVVANVSADMVQFQGVAHGLTSKFQVDPAAVSGIKDDVVVNLNFGFPDMASEIWNKRYLTHPQWTRTISPEPGQPLFPQEAVKAGLKEGSAMVDCVVGADGGLTQCAIVSESVPGVGLGVMAQKIAESFAANLWTEDGLPAEGAHVRMPIKLVDMDAKAATPSTPPTPPAASPGSPPPVR